MKEIHKPVLVHSCRIQPDLIPVERLMREERYVEVRRMKEQLELGPVVPLKVASQEIKKVQVLEGIDYRRLPKSCRCRRYISYYEADDFIEIGKALRTLKVKGGGIVKDENQIWMPVVRERVPRVDLIARADIERAYIGSEKRSTHYIYNKWTRKFELVRVIPDGMSREDWLEDAKKEVEFEQRIRKQYSQYIEECHKIMLESRAELMAPFRDCPCDGRLLFCFGPDQRTMGGHK